MSMLMGPVFSEAGHDLKAVEAWSLEDLGWWYLFQAKRNRAQFDAQKEAQRKAKEKR